ncbi:MAG: chromate efflux transporter [Myxococcales bacterium]|nr:chromate efflux transporter [Myxococcales bacterium]
MDAKAGQAARLREVALLFLRLGATAFGGPAAHIAILEDEVVRRRAWLTREEFLDLLGVSSLIPGPTSTELAIHIGFRRAGWAGLLLAGACFITPAALIVGGLAWAYTRFGALPEVAGLLSGVKPVVVAVVAQALVGFGRAAVKTRLLGALGVAGAAASFLGANELLVLFAAGALSAASRWASLRARADTRMGALAFVPLAALVPASAAAAPFALWRLFLFFLKVGSVLFGSGYVLLAFLRADLVERWGWLSEAQLIDAVAVGQVTPGPLFTTATFIGYLLGGLPGAAVATVGIFLPAFAFAALSGPLVRRVRASKVAGAFLDGVNVASLALMAVVTFEIGRASLVELKGALLSLASLLILMRFRVSASWLVLAGAAVGLLSSALR